MSGAEDTRFRLSKSKLAAFEHCPKRLWLQIHRREVAKFDEATLARFRFGHEVGRKAQFAVEGGMLVDTGFNMPAAIARTQELMAASDRRPIFEATFQFKDVLIRADILIPDESDSWRLIEVKASSSPRSYQFRDVATQLWVVINSGIAVSTAVIRHLARPVIWANPDVAAITFRDTDVSDPVARVLQTRPQIAAAARQTIRGPEPQRPIGTHCYHPFACEFRDHCRAAVHKPDLDNPTASSGQARMCINTSTEVSAASRETLRQGSSGTHSCIS